MEPAAAPRLRARGRGSRNVSAPAGRGGRQAPGPFAPSRIKLPAIVREGLVRFRHAEDFLLAADRRAVALRCRHELAGEPLAHRLLAALPREADQPAHGQRHLALGPDLGRDLVRGPTHTPRLYLELRPRVRERLPE